MGRPESIKEDESYRNFKTSYHRSSCSVCSVFSMLPSLGLWFFCSKRM